MAVAALLGACGGESSSESNEPGGDYDVRVSETSFPDLQRLGQTSLLRIGVRNTGERTVPNLAVTISIAGRQGQTSGLPFGIRDPQPGLAQPDRPVWVLAAKYPRLAGSQETAGASTANPKTFAFGPLRPGKTTTAVWKLSAVKAGRYTVRYEVAANLSGTANAKTAGGVAPGGTIATEITTQLPETEVTESGEVVEKPQSR